MTLTVCGYVLSFTAMPLVFIILRNKLSSEFLFENLLEKLGKMGISKGKMYHL